MVIELDQTGNLSQLANWTIHYMFIGKSSMSCTFFYVTMSLCQIAGGLEWYPKCWHYWGQHALVSSAKIQGGNDITKDEKIMMNHGCTANSRRLNHKKMIKTHGVLKYLGVQLRILYNGYHGWLRPLKSSKPRMNLSCVFFFRTERNCTSNGRIFRSHARLGTFFLGGFHSYLKCLH